MILWLVQGRATVLGLVRVRCDQRRGGSQHAVNSEAASRSVWAVRSKGRVKSAKEFC